MQLRILPCAGCFAVEQEEAPSFSIPKLLEKSGRIMLDFWLEEKLKEDSRRMV